MKKIIIITGASAGMGECFARQLYEESTTQEQNNCDEIWIIARRKERLEALAAELNKKKNKYKTVVKAIAMDISGRDGIKRFNNLITEETKKENFVISTLVNNAGFGTYGEFLDTPLDKELDMIDLNCTTLTGICGLSIPLMQKGSRLINTASLASFLPLGNFAVYGASKAFVLSFTIALAAEIKNKGIKVCALCPGPVSTEFANVASNGARKEVLHGLSPEKTVEHCLKAIQKGKLIALMAFKWKFKAFASRFIGRYIGAWFTYKYCKRPRNN